MKVSSYQQTPAGIMSFLNLFAQHQLSFLLFKCEHIFAGQNKNLDILFATDSDYRRAAQLLEQQNLAVRLSEQVEKYKTMYAGFWNKQPLSIHLHREIAWHGLVALDKRRVFDRAQQVHQLIKIPSLEDSILIHAAHALFENFKVTEKEGKYLNLLNHASGKDLDQEYIAWQLRRHHWQFGFRRVLGHYLRNPAGGSLPKVTVVTAVILKLLPEPATAAYLAKKIGKRINRMFVPKRGGCLISLSGINGSGKTTLAKEVLSAYQPFLNHLGKKSKYYYFGWEPEFILTRLISRFLSRRKKRLFEEINFPTTNLPTTNLQTANLQTANLQIAPTPRFSLFQELLYLYLFWEFYYRYWKHLRFPLQQGHLIITDRYFYDLWGQYPYASKSLIMKRLLKLFPQPDFVYLLDADLNTLVKRGKADRRADRKNDQGNMEMNTGNGEKNIPTRTVLPFPYLQQQQQNYALLSALLPVQLLPITPDLDLRAARIIQQSWRKVL